MPRISQSRICVILLCICHDRSCMSRNTIYSFCVFSSGSNSVKHCKSNGSKNSNDYYYDEKLDYSEPVLPKSTGIVDSEHTQSISSMVFVYKVGPSSRRPSNSRAS